MTTYPAAHQLPVTNHGGLMTAHLGLVLHVQQGNNGLQGWFSNPASQASSTFWVSKTGAVEQYVDAGLEAWAQAAGNTTYNSVETEGYDTEPLTSQQIDALAALYKWGNETYAWPYVLSDTVGTAGFAWHGMGGQAWGGHLACPGDLRKNARQQILTLASGAPPTPVPPPVNPTITVPPLHVDYFSTTHNSTVPDVHSWQARMAERGWTILVDGIYGPQSASVCRAFQAEKHLTVDGMVGPQTWNATWTAPIT